MFLQRAQARPRKDRLRPTYPNTNNVDLNNLRAMWERYPNAKGEDIELTLTARALMRVLTASGGILVCLYSVRLAWSKCLQDGWHRSHGTTRWTTR